MLDCFSVFGSRVFQSTVQHSFQQPNAVQCNCGFDVAGQDDSSQTNEWQKGLRSGGGESSVDIFDVEG